jgi:8-amino-7-oxononanoate synthase
MGHFLEKYRLWAGEQVERHEAPPPSALPAPGEAEVDGRRALHFGSDDALGLGTDSRVREAANFALRRYGSQGADALRPRFELEERLSAFMSAEAGIIAGGTSALLAALIDGDEAVISEAWTSAPLLRVLDRLSHQERVRDETALEHALATRHGALVVAPSVRPALGDLPRLPRFSELASKAQAALLIDETLAVGVLGARGAGAAEHLGLKAPAPIFLVGLSGALGSRGAGLFGPRAVVDWVRARIDPTDVPAPSAIAAATRALELLQAEPQRKDRLFEVSQRVIDGLNRTGFDTGPSVTHRIPVWIGDEVRCQRLAEALLESGVLVRTWVERGTARLIVSPQATHSDAQADQLVEQLAKLGKRYELLGPAPEDIEPVQLARPGTFAATRPCGTHWTAASTEESEEVIGPGLRERLLSLPPREMARKAFEAMETVTWRATNLKAPSLRRLLTNPAVRELFAPKKGRKG